MPDRVALGEILSGSEAEVLSRVRGFLAKSGNEETIEFLRILEDSELFKDRLPLRLRVYALIAESASPPELRMIALTRLLRRIGSRRDLPDLGDIPGEPADFAAHLARRAFELMGEAPVSGAVAALGQATAAFRAGDIPALIESTEQGLNSLQQIPQWASPSDSPGLLDLLVSETGHELMFLALNAAYRSGDIERARTLAEDWSEAIKAWEAVLGPIERVRYQYYQMAGHISCEVGLPADALAAYARALEYAPTLYRKAFLWMSMAQVERQLGLLEESWQHGIDAIEAWLSSPYPQVAATWIEWLALEARTPEKRSRIEKLRAARERAGGIEINRVSRAMTELYRLVADLHFGVDPSSLIGRLDPLIDELRISGSWPNLVTILATRAVLAGRIGDRLTMDRAIAEARELIATRLGADIQPPAQFFLESAHALALRDVGEYDEAFHTLFENALQARAKYPGAVGPQEQSALEALFYLGALAGYDPATIEKRVRTVLSKAT